MSENPTSVEWSESRGDKWRTHMASLEAMLRPIDEPLIDALQLGGASRIADLACGGGGTSLQVLARAEPTAEVHGYDIAPGLIEAARARIPAGETRLRFSVANLQTARPDQPYQRLISRFGTMFFEDPATAFSNLTHWLGPGGRFAFAVWGPARDNPWNSSVREVVAGVLPVPAVDPSGPGPFRYGEVTKLTQLLTGAGFQDVQVFGWSGRLAIGGGLPPERSAALALATMGSFSELLTGAPAEKAEEVERRLVALHRTHVVDGVVQMPARVHLVTGRR